MDNAIALTRAELSIGEYAPIRSAYAQEVYGAIAEYFLTDKARVTRFRNSFKKAISDYFEMAFTQGYTDGGGDVMEMDPEARSWLAAAIPGEWRFVEDLFDQMKILKAEADTQEMLDSATARAEGYAKTLDGIYNMGKLFSVKAIMLTFGGPDGLENCSTCARLKGKRHSAKWWMSRGLAIFRRNRNYECGCWQCQHFFYTDKGEVYTL